MARVSRPAAEPVALPRETTLPSPLIVIDNHLQLNYGCSMPTFRKMAVLAQWFAVAVALAVAAPALAQNDDVRTSWRLLDYLAVDYSGAVSNGKVVSQSEYAEMREFSASVREKLAGLPAKPQKPALVAASERLGAAIDRKASPDE